MHSPFEIVGIGDLYAGVEVYRDLMDRKWLFIWNFIPLLIKFIVLFKISNKNTSHTKIRNSA